MQHRFCFNLYIICFDSHFKFGVVSNNDKVVINKNIDTSTTHSLTL